MKSIEERLSALENLAFQHDAKYGKKVNDNESAVNDVKNKTDTLQIDMAAVGLTIDDLIIAQADIMTEFIIHILLIESEV